MKLSNLYGMVITRIILLDESEYKPSDSVHFEEKLKL
jgi:hypothetical protein